MRAAGAAALAAAFVLAAALGTQPLSHDDLFWHLRAGERMLDGGEVLHSDPFSYTLPGARWVTHEWGFSVAVAAVAGAGGLAPLVALRGVLVVAFFALVAAAAWRRAAGGGAARGAPAVGRRALPLLALLVAASAWAVSRELILRAALPGAVAFAVLVLALPAFRRRPTLGRGAAIAVLVLVWANLHSGVIFGLFLLALAAVEALFLPPPAAGDDPRRAETWRRRLARARPHLALLAAGSLAALANPNGLDAPLYPLRLALLLADPASGFDLAHFTGGWRGRQAILGLLVAAVAAGLLRAARRRRPLPTPGEVAAVAVFAVLSWGSDRLALELAALALPLAFALWAPRAAPGATATAAQGAAGGEATAGGRVWLAATACLVIAAGSLVVAVLVVAARPPGTISPAFPAGAAAFLERTGLAERRLFHHQNWGGYLGWRLDAPIFWDGRNDVFAPLVREVTTTPFPEVARRYGVEVLVLSERELADLAPLLGPGGDWLPVHASGPAAVFVRREPARAATRESAAAAGP
ncbi:MAG TPA: hypothetical protein VF100_04235 [Thermoanaerobaculia bacterium]